MLSVFRLNGLKLHDVSTDSPILSISSIEVRYNILAMLFGNIIGGIKEITLDSGLVYYNDSQHIAVGNRVAELLRKPEFSKKDKNLTATTTYEAEKKRKLSLELLNLIRIQNFTFAYESTMVVSHFTLSEVRIVYSPEAEQLNFYLSSRANARLKAAEFFSEDAANLKFTISGRLSQDFSDLSGRIKFETIQASAFILRNVVFNMEYSQNKFLLDLVQPRNQYKISAVLDVPQRISPFPWKRKISIPTGF